MKWKTNELSYKMGIHVTFGLPFVDKNDSLCKPKIVSLFAKTWRFNSSFLNLQFLTPTTYLRFNIA